MKLTVLLVLAVTSVVLLGCPPRGQNNHPNTPSETR
jgi:hypothetical protein